MKSKIIEQIQQRLPGHTTKAQATEALNVVLASIQHVAKNNDAGAQISGFGTFRYRLREGRPIKNPATGEMVQTTDKMVLTFKRSKAV